jgi:hypothetical protein
MECAPVRCGVQAISETIGQLPLIVLPARRERLQRARPESPRLFAPARCCGPFDARRPVSRVDHS